MYIIISDLKMDIISFTLKSLKGICSAIMNEFDADNAKGLQDRGNDYR